MFETSLLVEKRNLKDLKYLVRTSILVAITINFGVKAQLNVHEKTLLGSIQFISGLILLYRTAKLKRVTVSKFKEVFVYETYGNFIKWFILIITIIKLISEVLMKELYNPQKPPFTSYIMKFIFTQLMNEKIYHPSYEQIVQFGLSPRSLTTILITNSLDIFLLVIFILVDDLIPNKVNFSHLPTMRKMINSTLLPLKGMVYVFLMFEMINLKLNFFSMIYLLMLYILFRIQVNIAINKKKGGNKKYLRVTKWVIFFCMVIREVAIFIQREEQERINLLSKFKQRNETSFLKTFVIGILQQSLEGQFLKRFIVYFCCQYYNYLKNIKRHLNKLAINYSLENLNHFSTTEFKITRFYRVFLSRLPRIILHTHYYNDEKDIKAHIWLIDRWFKKQKWIKMFTLKLEEKLYEVLRMKKHSRLKSIFKRYFNVFMSSFASLLLTNIQMFFKFTLYMFTIQICSRHLDYPLYMTYFDPYDLCLLLWCLFSFIFSFTRESDIFLINYSINVIYPVFLFGLFSKMVVTYYREFMHYRTMFEMMKQSRDIRETSFFILLVYNMILLVKTNSKFFSAKYARWFQKRTRSIVFTKINFFDMIFDEIAKLIIRFSRLIALVTGIYASLMSINVFNTFLLVVTLFFLYTSHYDKRWWTQYLYYNILILILLFTTQVNPINFPHFNQEVVTMIGASKIDNDDYNKQFYYFFALVFFCSIYNNYKNKVLTKSNVSVEKWTKLRNALRRIIFGLKVIHVDYMIWVFHISLFILLAKEEASDVLSMFLFVFDIILFLVHLNIYWSAEVSKRSRLMLRVFYPSLIVVLMMIILRYLSFYIRYQFIRSFMEGLLSFKVDESYFMKILFRDLESRKVNDLSGEFVTEIILLGITIVTLTGLMKNRGMYLGDLKISVVEDDNPGQLALKMRKTELSLRPTNLGPLVKEFKQVKSERGTNLGMIREVKFDIEGSSDSSDPEGLNFLFKDGMQEESSEEEEKKQEPEEGVGANQEKPENEKQESEENKKEEKDKKDEVTESKKKENEEEEKIAEEEDPLATAKVENNHPRAESPIIRSMGRHSISVVNSSKNRMSLKNRIRKASKRGSLFSLNPRNSAETEFDPFKNQIMGLSVAEGVNPDKLFKDRNLVYFVATYILVRAISFLVVVQFLGVLSTPEPLDCFFIGVDLLSFNVLFWNISSVFNLFDVRSFINYQIEYFNRGFVKMLSEHNAFPSKPREYIHDFAVEQIKHNRFYMTQLIKKVEVEILTTSLSLVVLRLLVMLVQVLLFFLTKINVKSSKEENNLKYDCLYRIFILSLILFEVLLLKSYLSAKEYVEEQTHQKLAVFLHMFKAKFDYLLAFIKVKTLNIELKLKKKRRSKHGIKSVIRQRISRKKKLKIIPLSKETIWEKEMQDNLSFILKKRRIYIAAAKLFGEEMDPSELDDIQKKDFYFDSVEKCTQKMFRENPSLKLRFVMSEGTSMTRKLLFMHRNNYKYRYVLFLWAFKAAMRRILLVPLLYSSFTVQNPINIFILVPCWIYAYKGNTVIEQDIKVFMPFFSLIFVMLFSYEQLTKMDFFYTMVRIFDIPISDIQNKNGLLVFSGFVFIIAVSEVLTITIIYFISMRLFVVRKKFRSLFFYIRKSADGSKRIYLNFKAWKGSTLKMFSRLTRVVYLNATSYYLIGVFLLSILEISKANMILLGFVVYMTLCEVLNSLKRYSLRNLKPGQLKKLAKMVTMFIWFLNFKYNLIILLIFLKRQFSLIESIKEYITINEAMYAFGCVALLTFLITDLLLNPTFAKEASMVQKKKDINCKFVALSQAYLANENKVYERVKLMCKLSRLNDFEEALWKNQSDLQRLKFDYRYWHRDLPNIIRKSMNKLLKGNLTDKEIKRLGWKESLLKTLINNIQPSLFEDTLIIMLKVFYKNRFLLKKEFLDIEEFYAGHLEIYKDYFYSILKFYDKLRKQKKYESGIFMEKFLEKTNQVYQVAKDSSDEDKKSDSDQSLRIPSLTSIERGEDESFSDENGDTSRERVDSMRLTNIAKRKLMTSVADSIFRNRGFSRLGRSSRKRDEGLEMKDKEMLRKATDVLMDGICRKREEENLNLMKMLENTNTFECTYGKRKIMFFNLETNYMRMTRGMLSFKWSVLFKLLFRWVMSNYEMIVSIILIINQIIIGAFENFIILGILFFFILPEVSYGFSRWWKIIYLLFLIKCCCKYLSLIYLIQDQTNHDHFEMSNPINVLILLFGDTRFMPDVYCLILIFFLLQLLKSTGVDDKRLIDFEDTGSCTARLVVNSKKDTIYTDKSNMLLYKNDLQSQYVLKRLKRKQENVSLRNFKFDLIKQKIHLGLLSEVFRKEFTKHMITYLKRTRNNIFKASKKNRESFHWRNFSYYARKPGKSIQGYAATCLFISIFLTLAVLPMVGKDSTSLLTMIKLIFVRENVIIGPVTIKVLIYSIMLIVDRVLDKKFYHDKTGVLRRPMLIRQFKRMGIKLKKKSLFAHPVVKVRRALRKLFIIIRWRNMVTKQEETMAKNPQRRQFYASLVFFVVIHVYVLFSFISFANMDSNLPYFQGLSCFYNPKTTRCRDELKWIIIRIMYAFPVFYVYISVLQIHFGKEMFKSRVTKFDFFEKIGHAIQGNVPFGRELSIASDFLANKSALQFSHRLIYNDIAQTLRTSKFDELVRVGTGFGRTKMDIQKLVVGIGWSVLFLCFLFGPLLPFAIGGNDKVVYKVQRGILSVFLKNVRKENIGTLFMTNVNYNVRNYSIADNVSDRLIRQDHMFLGREQIQQLNLSTKAEMFPDVQDKFFWYRHRGDMDGIIEQITNGSITLRLEVELSNLRTYLFDSEMMLNSNNGEAIREMAGMIMTDCTSINYKRTIYLNRVPLVFQVPEKKASTMFVPKVKNESIITSTKFSLTSHCSDLNKKYFNLKTEFDTRDCVNFIIICPYNTERLTNFINELIGYPINVVLLYILLFRYLGVNIIRKKFFNQQSLIWFTQIPEPEKLICILDAIRYAQFEGDFLREELLFFKLIDILRNPEQVRQMTGGLRERQWEQFIRDKKTGVIK